LRLVLRTYVVAFEARNIGYAVQKKVFAKALKSGQIKNFGQTVISGKVVKAMAFEMSSIKGFFL
jgi:hypothetical protein